VLERQSRARGVARAIGVALLGTASIAAGDCPNGSAARLYDDARKAFEGKHFDDSVALLRQAYACNRDSVYLANIARCQEEANRPREALVAWRAYLAVVTDAQERTRVEGRLSALTKLVEDLDRLEREKEAAEQAQRAAERAAVAQPPPAVASVKRESVQREPVAHVPLGAWLLGAAGGLAMGGGVVWWGLASSKHSTANQELQQAEQSHASPQAAVLTNQDAQSMARAGNITFVAGGCVAAIGLVWAGISLLRPASSHDTISVGVRGSSIQLTGRF
jgi:hypothetical protein